MTPAPIPNLAEADAALVAALARQVTLRASLASAVKRQDHATMSRTALKNRIAAGQRVTPKEFADADAAIRAAEAQASITRDALPSVDALVKAAQQRVDTALTTEARRLEAAARTAYEAATQEAEAAEQRMRAAGEALAAATRFISSATNRRAWGGRVPAMACENTDYIDEMSPRNWAAFIAEHTQKQAAAVDHVADRHALADRILAMASSNATT